MASRASDPRALVQHHGALGFKLTTKGGSSVGGQEQVWLLGLSDDLGMSFCTWSPRSVGASSSSILPRLVPSFRRPSEVLPRISQSSNFSIVFFAFVSSNLVGFYIIRLHSFDCSAFKIFLHLWGNGGPN